MATAAEKCVKCNSWYNSSQYKECPYCSKTNITPKKSFLSGLFAPRRNSEETSNLKEPHEQSEEVTKAQEPQIEEELRINNSMSEGLEQEIIEQECKAEEFFGGNMRDDMMKTDSCVSAQEENIDGSMPLAREISLSGRTIGKYITNRNGEYTFPVVGWLVCVKGEYYGQCFQIRKGKNRVGRSHELEIKLLNEESVSRTCVATIVYDAKNNKFYILPGESDSLSYVNGEAIFERIQLTGYEELEFCDNGKNKYMFVPFCSDKFQWTMYPNE